MTLWIQTLLIVLMTLPCFSGGFSTSGGGSGVACFSSSTKAKHYQKLISNGEELPEVFFKDVKSLVTLESWERGVSTTGLVAPLKDWQSTLQAIHKNIYYISPLFLFRLQQFADIVKVSEWKSTSKLELLEDAVSSKPISENCVRVQIAKRYSMLSGAISGSLVNKYFVAKIEFNQRLFSMLSVLDQAILVLHEQLYLIGGSIGHVNSDVIRKFVNLFILNRNLDKEKLRHFYSSKDVYLIRWNLVSAFGDYPVYFANEKLSQAIVEKSKMPFTSQSRFYSFLETLLRLRKKVWFCREHNKNHENGVIPNCLEFAVQDLRTENDLTNEQAFVFVAFFGIDRGLGMNSEYLFDPSLEEMSVKDAEASVFVFCNEIVYELNPDGAPFYAQAIQYCQEVKEFQITKKKDQN